MPPTVCVLPYVCCDCMYVSLRSVRLDCSPAFCVKMTAQKRREHKRRGVFEFSQGGAGRAGIHPMSMHRRLVRVLVCLSVCRTAATRRTDDWMIGWMGGLTDIGWRSLSLYWSACLPACLRTFRPRFPSHNRIDIEAWLPPLHR